MALTIRSSVENEIAILELEGALTLGPALHQIRAVTAATLKQHRLRGLVLDLAHVTTADSAGLGELTLVYTMSGREGCPIVVAGAHASIRHMLQVTHLDGLLNQAPSLPEAIATFK